jgi:tetratricopeptide (TPR) repeat protein
MSGDQVRNTVSGTGGYIVQAGMIRGGVHIHQEASQTAPRQLPAAPRGFTGRDEQVAALDALLMPAGEGPVPIAVVSGMAGAGKTALAVHWAHHAADAFPDGQLYADLIGYGPAGRPADPTDVLGGFLRALGVPPDQVPVDAGERAAEFRSRLSGRKVLVVLDNARGEDQVRPLLPGAATCAVIVTSRHPMTGLIVDHGAELVSIGLLSATDATTLLRTLIGSRSDAEPAAVAALAEHCAQLPLALRIAAGLARSQPTMALAELATTLADKRTRLDTLDAGDARTAARTVFSWSYEQLPSDVAWAFRLLGLSPGASVGQHVLAALADVPPAEALRLLNSLARGQMVTAIGGGVFRVHDLLRAYAAELVRDGDTAEDHAAAERRVFEYYLHTADRADNLLTPNRFRIPLSGTARPAPVFVDSDQAFAWLEGEQDAITALFELDGPELDTDRWQLAYTMRNYYFFTKRFAPWVHSHQLALAAAQRAGDPTAEAVTRNNLGMALLELGRDEEAAAHYQRAQELFEQVGDVRGASNALANRSWISHKHGDHQAALDAATTALHNYRAIGATRNVGITLRGMAEFEAAMGRLPDAIAHVGEAMEMFVGSELDLAMTLNSLGELQHQVGDAAASGRAHAEAVAVAIRCGSGFEQARGVHGLGRAALLAGDRAAAAEHLAQAQELYRRLGVAVPRELG